MEEAITAGGSGQGVLALPRLGAIWLAWDDAGIVALDQRAQRVTDARRLEQRGLGREEREVPRALAEPFEAFDRGEPIDLAAVPVVLRGPPFFVAVWRALRSVKRGSVRTYGGLARDVESPRATRAVGTAMARNPLPLVVPCHRVIADGSMLGGYSDGVRRKIMLLAMEGVRVDGDRVLEVVGGDADPFSSALDARLGVAAPRNAPGIPSEPRLDPRTNCSPITDRHFRLAPLAGQLDLL